MLMEIGWQWKGRWASNMATLGEYLQTWKLQNRTTKKVSVVFHLCNKEAKHELKGNFNNGNPALLLQAQIPQSNVIKVAHIPPTPWVTLQEANIMRCTPEAACWFWLGCWSNNVANSHPSPGPFDCRVLHSCLVPQCSYPPYWPHQRRLANCDWMPASYTSGQPYNPRRYPTCWASSQRSHTISRTPCHGAWTPAPLGTHPDIGYSCTAPRIETPICTRRTTTHQFFWQQQHTRGAVGGSSMERGVGGQPHKTLHVNSRHCYTHTHPGMTLPRRAWVNRLRTGVGRFCFFLYKWGMASSAACECGAQQTIDHVVLYRPIHRPPTDHTAWRFWMVRQPNGYSTPAPISRQASSG